MVAPIIRYICVSAVRIYFRKISFSGQMDADPARPTLIVANHPNGLLDPIVVQLALDRKVLFLGKSTLFANIVGRTTALAFGAIPVYRRKDGQDTSKNHSMFGAVYDSFGDDAWVLIFPEGVSHDETQLLPLKTGAARIAMGAECESLQILPLGITYENKHQFRSRVNVNFGTAVPWTDLHGEEKVRLLTDRITQGMQNAMFETPSEGLRQGMLFVARWLENDAPLDRVEEKAKTLEFAYGNFLADDPQGAQKLADDVLDFARDLEGVGLEPWNLEAKSSITGLAFLLLLSPIALLGFLTHYPVYLLIRFLVDRMTKNERDLLGTLKTIGGIIFYPLAWIFYGLLFAYFFNWKFGLAAGILSIPLSLFTLLYMERFKQRRRALSHFWLTRLTPDLAREIRQTRDHLVDRISNILQKYEQA